MAGPCLFDRVKDTTSTTGTGTLTLANSAPTGFRTFGSVLSNSDTVYYTISSSGGSEWECGIGTYTTSGTTLARTVILASSNSGSVVNLSSGTKDVYCSPLSEMLAQQAGILLTNNYVCQGRLTLESGVPVPTTDQTAKTNVYFTPYFGNQIALYSGAYWKQYTFSELTLALGTISDATNYDVFIYDNAGTLTLEALAWTNDTTRATALVLQDGVYCKTGALTRRYLGTFRTTATTTTEDSLAKRFLWNQYNQVLSPLQAPLETANLWSYTTNTWRQANANSANQFEYVTGDSSQCIVVNLNAACNITGLSSRTAKSGIGIDSTTSPFGLIPQGYNNSGSLLQYGLVGSYEGFPGLGYHYVAWIEKGSDGTCSFVGDDGGNGQCGIYGSMRR